MLTLVRVWTSLLSTMSGAVSVVHHIAHNVFDSSFVLLNKKKNKILTSCYAASNNEHVFLRVGNVRSPLSAV